MTKFSDELRAMIVENSLISGVQPIKKNEAVEEILKNILAKPSFQESASADYGKTYTEGRVGQPEYTRYDRTHTTSEGENWKDYISQDEISQIIEKFRI